MGSSEDRRQIRDVFPQWDSLNRLIRDTWSEFCQYTTIGMPNEGNSSGRKPISDGERRRYITFYKEKAWKLHEKRTGENVSEKIDELEMRWVHLVNVRAHLREYFEKRFRDGLYDKRYIVRAKNK